MREPEVIVVAAGPGPAVPLPLAATVIAADGGLDRALELGLSVDLVVGDLDSVSPTTLARAEASGTRVIRHPTAKDATDLELALDEAAATGARRLLVVLSVEGRLDHLLAATLLLASERYAALELDALVGGATVHVIRGARRLETTPGELVTLIAVGGPADGISTEGLLYPLAGATLEPGSSRGVSNVVVAPSLRIMVGEGVLLAIRSGSEA